MKKVLILTCALCVITGASYANEPMKKPDFAKKCAVTKQVPPNPEQMKNIKKAHEAAFEQKLGLTEVQKLKARELRKTGHEKIKPVISDIKAKKQEAEAIRQSKLSIQEQEAQLTVIDKDINELQKQAQKIRKQNMKKEGRKNFEESRRQLPPPPCKPMNKQCNCYNPCINEPLDIAVRLLQIDIKPKYSAMVCLARTMYYKRDVNCLVVLITAKLIYSKGDRNAKIKNTSCGS